jgi:hypothetical protein
MKNSPRLLAAALTALVLAITPIARAEGYRLEGRAHEAPDGQGLAALTIRLVAPAAARLPDYVTTTATDGTFRLQGIPAGHYVLEVSRGSTLVLRRPIVIEHDGTEDIALRVQERAP